VLLVPGLLPLTCAAARRKQRPAKELGHANGLCRSLRYVLASDGGTLCEQRVHIPRPRRQRPGSREATCPSKVHCKRARAVDSGWRQSGEPLERARLGERPARTARGVMVVADRGEPILGIVQLTRDHLLDVEVKRSVRAKDELAQHRHQWAVLSG